MNRKGFTLIELLATIAIIAIVFGIASYSLVNTINNSKLKSEKIFVDKLSNLIDDYLDLYTITNITGTSYTFTKCRDIECTTSDSKYEVETFQVLKSDDSIITINDLVSERMITLDDLVNPKNNKQCFDDAKNPEIKIYKDSDYVYYYYVDLNNNNCDIEDENALISTLPDNLVEVLCHEDDTLPICPKDE